MSNAAGSNAKEINAQAASWLERCDSGDWSDADQAALDAWLALSSMHRAAYWRLKAAWSNASRLTALGHVPQEAISAERRNSPAGFKIAAALAIMAVLGGVAANALMSPRERLYSTAVGGRERIGFADGSRIELNTDTVLRTRMTTADRTVWLDRGEAFFQIKHDAAHPFVVMVGEHRVTDLGTKFLIRRDPGRLEVALIEGKARFGAADARRKSPSAVLLPGDVATATAGTMFVTREPAKKLSNELGWQRGLIVFKYTSLGDAASEFNRYNRQKLVIADPQAARLTIVGTFRTSDVAAFAATTKSLFKLRVENDGDEIVISR